MTTINNKNYKNPLIDVGNFVSDYFEKNQENQIAGTSSECILCGKGIKSAANHYTVVSGNGSPEFLIHKDEWGYAESQENTDGGFVGGWDIGSECVKKLKHISNIENYIRKPQKECA